MKTSLRTIFLSFLVVIVMGLGTYSRAVYAAEAKPIVLADAVTPTAPAQAAPPAGMKLIPEDFTADFNLSLYSQYIWRGYELSKDSFVMFPQFTIGYKGFAATAWIDLDTRYYGHPEGDHKRFKLPETDFILTYSNSVAPVKLNYTLGWIYYDTKGAQGMTPFKNQELFVTLGLDTILKPTLSIYQEIEIGHAWYFSLGGSHSFNVYKDWSLDLAGWVSYMHNTAVDDPKLKISAFHDGNISAGLKIPLNSYVSIKPNLQWSFPLSSAAGNRIKYGSNFGDGHNTFVYGGLILDFAI